MVGTKIPRRKTIDQTGMSGLLSCFLALWNSKESRNSEFANLGFQSWRMSYSLIDLNRPCSVFLFSFMV